MKRYVREPGSAVVRTAMASADAWYMCRIGYVETVRAVSLAAGTPVAEAFRSEWRAFGVVEVDEQLAEHAAGLAATGALRSRDALHLAAALLLPHADLALATWDRRLHQAAADEGLEVVPERLP